MGPPWLFILDVSWVCVLCGICGTRHLAMDRPQHNKIQCLMLIFHFSSVKLIIFIEGASFSKALGKQV